jgi:hypothetical protein
LKRKKPQQLKDYDARLRDLRAQIDAADADIEAGLGITFANARALSNAILRRAIRASGRKRLMPARR